MRASIFEDDPGYNENFRYQVFLNGQKVSKCLTADEEEGFILRYQTDANGEVVLSESQDEILTEELRGKVKLKKL